MSNILKIKSKKYGAEHKFPFLIGAVNVITDPEHQFVTGQEKKNMVKTTDKVEFTPAGKRDNIESGETLPTILGKIHRYFEDLGTAAFKGVSNSINTESEAYVASSKAVGDVNRRVDDQVGNVKITYEGGSYYMQNGADTASKKKLGRGMDHWTVIAEEEYRLGIQDSPAAMVQVEKQYDIKTFSPGYQNLTASDFYAEVTSVKTAAQIPHGGFDNISYGHGIKKYDPSTGILTVYADTWQHVDVNLLKSTFLRQTLKIYLCG